MSSAPGRGDVRQLLTLIGGDLRQRMRDGSVVVFGLVVPAVLIFVLNLTFGGIDDIELDPIRVAVNLPPDDEMAQALIDAALGSGAVDARATEMTASQVRRRVERGDYELGLVVPEGFGERVQGGRRVAVEAINGDAAGLETSILLTVVDSVLERFGDGAVVARAAVVAGIDPADVAEVAERAASATSTIELTDGEVADEQLSPTGALVAGQAGLFVMFTVGFGVLGLITEREQGTLSRLRSMPMRPGLVVLSKTVVSYVLGVVATTVLLTIGSVALGASFGAVAVVAALVACVVAAATSLMFIVVRIARTSEQAGMIQSILALVLGIAGGAFVSVSAPGAWGDLLELNPVSAFIRGLGVSHGGGSISDVSGELVTMLGFAAVAAAVSRLVPDRGSAT